MRCLGNPFSRRNFLTVGALGGLGLTLADFFRMRAAHADQKSYDFIPAKAESVIHIFLPGGMAHQESFDPKPYSPLEYRGEMGTIKTKTGEVISETLPRLAGISDKFTIIRSMTHGEAAHERGTHNMFTGYKPSPALIYPSFGSVISHEYGPRENLPPYICIPNRPNEFAGSGYLSSSYGPFSLGADPANNGFKVQDLNLSGGVDETRFARRRAALDSVNQYFATRHNADAVGAMDSFYERAYSLISSEKARLAFDIEKEDAAMRDRYGRNTAGQRLLLRSTLGRVRCAIRFADLRRLGHAPTDHSEFQEPDATVGSSFDCVARRSRFARHVGQDAGHGQLRVRSHTEDQRRCGPRSLAEGVQRDARWRWNQTRFGLRCFRPNRFRA